MIPTRDVYEGYLLCNPSWTSGAPGVAGKTYLECLADWNLKKTIMLRMIYKDLGELYAEDDEFATEVSLVLKNWLSTAKWQTPCGPIPIWKGMFSRAKGIVRKQMGNGDLEILSKGLLKNGKAETRTASVSKPVGVSSPPSRPGSRTSGPGGHADEPGSR